MAFNRRRWFEKGRPVRDSHGRNVYDTTCPCPCGTCLACMTPPWLGTESLVTQLPDRMVIAFSGSYAYDYGLVPPPPVPYYPEEVYAEVIAVNSGSGWQGRVQQGDCYSDVTVECQPHGFVISPTSAGDEFSGGLGACAVYHSPSAVWYYGYCPNCSVQAGSPNASSVQAYIATLTNWPSTLGVGGFYPCYASGCAGTSGQLRWDGFFTFTDVDGVPLLTACRSRCWLSRTLYASVTTPCGTYTVPIRFSGAASWFQNKSYVVNEGTANEIVFSIGFYESNVFAAGDPDTWSVRISVSWGAGGSGGGGYVIHDGVAHSSCSPFSVSTTFVDTEFSVSAPLCGDPAPSFTVTITE